ncbi:hypothetical protein SEA_SIENNA_90 [Gordonia phage Sienna]|uniref:Uncharacterized protein n=1 Tax=Gordonia phage Sienna TaxID=2759396 RepID=A0A7L7SUS1_9CAUD|nr:hypothetical protein SEA_SIENNA_90 [Gordonia phage Sienna]
MTRRRDRLRKLKRGAWHLAWGYDSPAYLNVPRQVGMSRMPLVDRIHYKGRGA